jgi:hypothetical protein
MILKAQPFLASRQIRPFSEKAIVPTADGTRVTDQPTDSSNMSNSTDVFFGLHNPETDIATCFVLRHNVSRPAVTAVLALFMLFIFGLGSSPTAYCQNRESDYFHIQVVDELTGRGVPLVELETVNHVRYVTDSGGNIAFFEPGLMNQQVFFHVKSHGYEFQADGFGYRGKSLLVKPDSNAILKIKRINLAERLYRITGQGIYRDSVLLGLEPKISQPLLNAKVMGSDSVVNAVVRDKLYWFWGDTNRPKYPLGNFHVPGATSGLPANGELDPELGIDLKYFQAKDGFAKQTATMPGSGPTWINGLYVFDENGQPGLYGMYVKIANPMKVYERGIVKFNFETNEFEKAKVLPLDTVLFPYGHPISADSEAGKHIYFCDPFPLSRVANNVSSYLNPDCYESYSAAKSGTSPENVVIARKQNGMPDFQWRKNAMLWTRQNEEELVKLGKLKSEQCWHQLRAVDTGKPVNLARGTLNWNQHRKKWVMVAMQSWGDSMLGEVWYSESVELMGPWAKAVKIVTHDQYSFYNVRHHSYFDKNRGKSIFFEGTYTTMFSGNTNPTPRYDYNQIMYKLDLLLIEDSFD